MPGVGFCISFLFTTKRYYVYLLTFMVIVVALYLGSLFKIRDRMGSSIINWVGSMSRNIIKKRVVLINGGICYRKIYLNI